MSMVENLAFGVDMMLFSSIFIVVISAVGVYVGPSYFIRLPPAVRRTRCRICLCGRSVATMFPYVIWCRQSSGMSL